MRDGDTEEVYIKNQLVSEKTASTRDILLRAMGSDILICGDERKIVKALENLTLQGASDRSLKEK